MQDWIQRILIPVVFIVTAAITYYVLVPSKANLSFLPGNHNSNECITKADNITLVTQYCFSNVSYIPVNTSLKDGKDAKSKYKGVILLFDPLIPGNYTVALVNLAMKIPFDAELCYYNYTKCPGVVTLEETKKYQQYLFVAVYLSNETKIVQDGNVIYINATESEIRKAIDRFIFFWYGVNG